MKTGQRGVDLAAMTGAGPPSDGAAAMSNGIPADYIETAAAFIAEDDPPVPFLIPELLPIGMVMLIHGEPRARKSLAALEIALAAATGTAAFGLDRFTPVEPVTVLYIQEEDPRPLTRLRLRALITARCAVCPDTLHIVTRRGVNLDDPVWAGQLTADLQRLGAKLLVLDAARRLSAKTDEGPAKVRELVAVLRAIVTLAGVTIVIVHHDVKPPANSPDQRRRSQRASGGDWFAACECPVHVEKIGARESLMFPEDYKHGMDPSPFTFTCEATDGVVTRLVGIDTSTDQAERSFGSTNAVVSASRRDAGGPWRDEPATTAGPHALAGSGLEATCRVPVLY
jgi:AAA domain